VQGVKSTYSDYSFKAEGAAKPNAQEQTRFKIEKSVSEINVKPEELFSKDVIEFFKPIHEENPKVKEEPVKQAFCDVVEKEEKEAIPYKVIGQIFDTYIIVEQNNKMLLIDQHAAHERINFNKLATNKRIDGQMLLCPEMITVTELEADVIESNTDIFEKLGFEIENFGDNKFVVRQAPTDISAEFVDSTVHEIVSFINKGLEPEQLWDKALFTVACKSAVKANTHLGEKEIMHLVNIVLTDERVKTCPHGRPVVIAFDKKFIEKEFKRIV